MARTPKSQQNEQSGDMWVRPTSTFKNEQSDDMWVRLTTVKQEQSAEIDRNNGSLAKTSRFLEMADIALGLKKTKPKLPAESPGSTHQISAKTEPYSN